MQPEFCDDEVKILQNGFYSVADVDAGRAGGFVPVVISGRV
jgi:hypothetical protein